MSKDDYIIETQDGEWKETISTPWRRLIKRVPKVIDGMITIYGRPYVIDPKKMRRERYRMARTLFLREYEMRIQLWRENEPDPVEFFDARTTPGSIGVTGETIKLYSKSEHLRRLVQPEKDWILIVVLAVLASVAAGAIGYSLGLSSINGVSP